ncbi:MAG: EI24 domain-containing protein [Bacteroidia bacterium]|nr:EI24 domain-containing protein [Bacteroidia bacterium]
MNDLIKGFTAPFQAFGFIFSRGMAKWYLVPILIWVVLVFGSTFTLAGWLSPYIKTALENWLGESVGADANFWEMVKGWLHTGLQFASAWVLHILIWYFLGRIMKYVILIIMSPLLAYLSEKTESILTGKEYPFEIIQLLQDAWRGVLITLRNLGIELFFMAIGFFLSMVLPPVAPFIGLALFGLNSYFMGFSMFDYYTERQRMNISDSVGYIRQNRNKVLGLGLGFNVMSFVPFADWVIAPINGAVGAVLCLEHEPDFQNNSQ